MEEYALNTFPEIASQDPLRILDLGNDTQILVDTVTGNKTGETDRASRNIEHALGEPYKFSEIGYNVLTNASPLVVGAMTNILKKIIPSIFKGIKSGVKASKPYYKVVEGEIKTPAGRKSWRKFSDRVLNNLKEGDTLSKTGTKTTIGAAATEGAKTTGKQLLRAGIKGATGNLGKQLAAKSAYGLTRPHIEGNTIKPILAGLVNMDFEDPARFNQKEVELAHQVLFGTEGFQEAMNEGATPRQLISEIRAAIRENPDIKEQALSEYRRLKEELLHDIR